MANSLAGSVLPVFQNGSSSLVSQPIGGTGNINFPTTTAPQATGTAIGLGQDVNSQLPGYNASLGNIGSNIASETAGQLPPDVVNQITQAAAERGISTGTGGSANSNAALLSALGLNSLQLTQQGQTNFQSILPSLPGATLYENPALYATPSTYESASATSANIANQQQQQSSSQAFETQQQNQALAQAKAGLNAGLGTGGGTTLPTPAANGFGTVKPGATTGGGYDPAPNIGTASGGGNNNTVFTPSLNGQSPGLVYGNAYGDGGGEGNVGSTLDQIINSYAPSSGSSYFGDESGNGDYYGGGDESYYADEGD